MADSSTHGATVIVHEKSAEAKKKMLKFMDSSPVMVLMIVATVFALFGLEFYALIDPPKDSDQAIYTVSFIVFIMFCAEWAIFTWAKPGYSWSFFFYLDFIAAVSLLPDVLYVFGIIFIDSSAVTVARAGRAARAGTRAVRIVRIFKILTLVSKKKKQSKEGTVFEEERQMEPSKVGTKLMDLITQKVIVIVALMLILTNVLDALVAEFDESYLTQLEHLSWIMESSGGSISDEPFRSVAAKFIETNQETLLFLSVHSTVVFPAGWEPSQGYPWEEYRENPSEILRVTQVTKGATGETFLNTMLMHTDKVSREQAWVSVIQVAFIILLLGVSSWLFSRDAQALVITPLEKMADLVKRMSDNPMMPIEESSSGEYETDFVESSLKKFGKLLQIAFGEAGADIIGKNLSKGGELDPMIKGRKIDAIYGFCDIRNFTDCTECLQEKVMVFVNTIAKYVHYAVRDNEGAPNKNIGDAFLLVWRRKEQEGRAPDPPPGDASLRSFCRIVLETNLCTELLEMTEHPAIQKRIPGYKVKMGFGLHFGWAIEGAIGTTHKIDASYLSPHVNMSGRLEAATKQYGVLMLLSEHFYLTLSPKVQALCRKIDRVTVKGSDLPMEMYTYDCHQPAIGDTIPDTRDITPDFWDKFPPVTSNSFRKEFSNAVSAYIDGKWDLAGNILRQCLAQNKNDGPSNTLWKFVKETNFAAPTDWPGYRVLKE